MKKNEHNCDLTQGIEAKARKIGLNHTERKNQEAIECTTNPCRTPMTIPGLVFIFILGYFYFYLSCYYYMESLFLKTRALKPKLQKQKLTRQVVAIE